MSKSIFLLKSEKYKDFLACADISVEKMSDFEKFAFACEKLPEFLGSEFYSEFLSTLSEELSEHVDVACLSDRENQKNIWGNLYGEETVCLTKTGTIDISNLIKEIKLPKKLDAPLSVKEFDDIERLIQSFDGDILLDTENFEYSRPDKYHVDLAYGKLRRGEACEKSELSALLLWILSSLLMREKRSVYLILNDKVDAVKAVIDYIEQRKLSVNIYICVENLTVEKAFEISDICLNAKKKNISSVILDHEENDENFSRGVLTLFKKLPSTRIYASNSKTAIRIKDIVLNSAVLQK